MEEYINNYTMKTRLLLLASALLLSAEMAMAQDYSVPVSEKNEKMMEGMPVAEIMHEDEQTEIDVLYFAINQLPPERRRIFMMVYAEGKKYKEVAEHLQISINTVRTQLSRSLKFLREKLEGHMFTILLLYFRKSE